MNYKQYGDFSAIKFKAWWEMNLNASSLFALLLYCGNQTRVEQHLLECPSLMVMGSGDHEKGT